MHSSHIFKQLFVLFISMGESWAHALLFIEINSA